MLQALYLLVETPSRRQRGRGLIDGQHQYEYQFDADKVVLQSSLISMYPNGMVTASPVISHVKYAFV